MDDDAPRPRGVGQYEPHNHTLNYATKAGLRVLPDGVFITGETLPESDEPPPAPARAIAFPIRKGGVGTVPGLIPTTYRGVGREHVRVKGGAYDAWKIEIGDKPNPSGAVWLAPGVGIVKIQLRSGRIDELVRIEPSASDVDEDGAPPGDACAATLDRHGGEIFHVTWRDKDGSRFFALEAGRALIGFVRFTRQDPATGSTVSARWAPMTDQGLQGAGRTLRGWQIFVTLSPQTTNRMGDFKRGAEECVTAWGAGRPSPGRPDLGCSSPPRRWPWSRSRSRWRRDTPASTS